MLTTPRERPILFSSPMVRALLEGRKTQTRRVVKPQPFRVFTPAERDAFLMGGNYVVPLGSLVVGESRCPFGVPGDRLWVKETHQFYQSYGERGELNDYWTSRCEGDRPDSIEYFATVKDGHHPDRWRPSIHMPRWASRITLEVVSVRVERVESISELDALAEGFEGETTRDELNGVPGTYVVGSARDQFLATFYDLNKRAPRGTNPWVWAITFKRLEQP